MSTERINFQYDGLAMNPLESSDLLNRILNNDNLSADSYSCGGVVEKLEKEMAAVLGKEAAVFMPTGTLANHLALRNLSSPGSRIIVQEESHIYKDSGDCMQALSGKNLIPLKSEDEIEGAGFSLNQVRDVVSSTSAGKVETGIGVISIESPVRRMNGMIFPRDEMNKILDYAKENGIKTHLDGARLFIAAAWYGITPAEYVEKFDTVYVSLYKYFNAPFGAILAGSKEIIKDLYHQRRMFGGGLNEAWPSAVFAVHSLKNFDQRYKNVIDLTKKLKDGLNSLDGLSVDNITNGTNVFRLILDEKININLFKESLEKKKIVLPAMDEQFYGFSLKTNESLLADSLKNMILYFKDASGIS